MRHEAGGNRKSTPSPKGASVSDETRPADEFGKAVEERDVKSDDQIESDGTRPPDEFGKAVEEREIKLDDQIEWIDKIYFLRNVIYFLRNVNSPQPDSLGSSGAFDNSSKRSGEGAPEIPNSAPPPRLGSSIAVDLNTYEESERRCDVLFRMSEAYRSLWSQEDNLCDQRTSRFWLINAGLFYAVWLIFSSECHLWNEFKTQANQVAVPVLNLLTSCEILNGSYNSTFILKNIFVFFVCIFGAFNTIVFLSQQNLGEKAFALLYARYRTFLRGVFKESSILCRKDVDEYIRKYNFSGVSFVPPIFGLHAHALSKGVKPAKISFMDGSYYMLKEEDGYQESELLKNCKRSRKVFPKFGGWTGRKQLVTIRFSRKRKTHESRLLAGGWAEFYETLDKRVH